MSSVSYSRWSRDSNINHDVHLCVQRIDSGLADNFYEAKQLLPEDFEAAARKAGHSEEQVTIRLRPGYDHSYFFIATFGPEHVKWHAKFLKA